MQLAGPAMTVGRFVKVASKQLGVGVRADESVSNDVVLTSFKSPVTARTALECVADVLDARWVNTSGTWTLQRDRAKYEGRKAVWLQEVERQIREQVAKMAADLETQPTFSKASAARLLDALHEIDSRDSSQVSYWPRIEEICRTAPCGRALNGLLRMVPIGELARINPGDCVVYSNSPTATERVLSHSDEVLKLASDEIDTWVSYLHDNPGQVGRFGGDPRASYYPGARLSRFVLLFENAGFGRLEAILLLQDGDGATLSRGDAVIRLPWTSPLEFGQNYRELGSAPDYRLTPESLDLCRIWNLLPGVPGYPASTDRRVQVMSPEDYEPIAITVGDLLRSAFDQNVVAALPDTLLYLPSSIVKTGSINKGAYKDYLRSRPDLELRESFGVTTLRPSARSVAERVALDRHATTALLRSSGSLGAPSLDDLSSFACSCRFQDASPVCRGALEFVSDWGSLPSLSDWPLYRFYGSLPVSQRRALWEGRTTRVGDLPSTSQKLLERCMYAQTDNGSRGIRPRGNSNRFGQLPWELLPSGLSPGAEIRTRVEKRPRLFSFISRPDGNAFWVEVGEGALYASASDRFRQISINTLAVEVQVTASRYYEFTLEERVLSPDAPEMTFDQLPETVQTEVNRLRRKNKRLQDVGHTTPPPAAR
jgi:hypothetical protein